MKNDIEQKSVQSGLSDKCIESMLRSTIKSKLIEVIILIDYFDHIRVISIAIT